MLTESMLKESFTGKTISNIYKETDNYGKHYWVIEFEGGGETSVRFMSEIVSGG